MRKEPRTTNFTGEMISEILLWLPPKSPVQFRHVSKYWESLISSAAFVRSHLDHSIKHRQFSLLQHDDKRLSKLSTRSPDGDLLDIDLGPSLPAGVERFEWVGSYNGALCIAVFCQNDPGHRRIQLCNPSINEAIMLPKSELQVSKVGFGFNPLSGHADADHTVNTESFPVVEMYSLRTNSWKMIRGLSPSWIRGWMDRHIIFREFICWRSDSGDEDKSFSIRLFRIADEFFCEMPIRDGMVPGLRFLDTNLECLWTILHRFDTSWKYSPLGFCGSEVIFLGTTVFVARKQKSRTTRRLRLRDRKGSETSYPDRVAQELRTGFVRQEFDTSRAGKWFEDTFDSR